MAETQLILSTIVKWTESATKALNDVKGSLDWVGRAAKESGDKMPSFTDKIKANKDWFIALWAASAATTAGLVVWIKSAMDTFGEFEQTMSWVKAVLNPTWDEFEKLSKKARELWKSTAYSAKESASAIEMLAKNWLTATQILEWATDATLALAASTWADLASAADIASSAMLVFWKQVKQLDQVVNSITWTTNLSKFWIQDYALALAQGWWVAKTVWVNFEDFNAAIAAISPLFQSWSDAWTSFKTFLLRLVPQSKEAIWAMKDLWLMTKDWANQFYDAAWKMKSMAEISQILKDATKNLSDEQKNETLNTIFWTDAMRAAAGMAWVWAEEFTKLSKAIEWTDAVKNAKDRMDNWRGAMEQLNWVIDEVMISIWEWLAPVLRKLVEDLWPVLTKIWEWINQHPELTANIILVTTAVAWITTALILLWLAIPPITAAISALWVVLWIIFSPIWLVAAAIIALWAAIYYVWKNWDTIKPKLLKIWEDIKKETSEIVWAIWAFITGTFDTAMKAVENSINWLKTQAKKAKEYVSDILWATWSFWSKLTIQWAFSALSWAKANGWPVGWWKSYLVWEKWPEIFTPWVSGQIIPNHKISWWSGWITINITWTFGQWVADEIWNMIVSKLRMASYI